MTDPVCTINFHSNYDRKLQLPIFTTIRPDTQDNRERFKKALDEPVQITYQKDPVRIMDLINVESVRFGNLPFGFLSMTTGLETKEKIDSLFEMFEIYPADPVLILTLHDSTSSQ